uniref:AlNc14C231G9297 protein n=1 Tax=Albugo laibachii Nc14 TaxID=890382 RepID=F0WSF6_9STRA|nr:AlNc14C231G9297 [Albugo laibachii Nc14]|eukprot:CCA24277.1 AlNc14C231G9297 [Albugo laibachii Nc14]
MKATLFRCILVALWRFGCYAENLDSFTISVNTIQHAHCQYCLLEHAGAIHVEEMEKVFGRKGSLNYWVVGSPNIFGGAHLIRCISPKACNKLIITKTNAQISTEGIGGIFSQLPTVNKPTENDSSAMQTLSVTPVGTSEEHRADFPLDMEHMNQLGSKRDDREPEQQCLYKPDSFSAAACETCLQTKSGSGILEKYLVQTDNDYSLCM